MSTAENKIKKWKRRKLFLWERLVVADESEVAANVGIALKFIYDIYRSYRAMEIKNQQVPRMSNLLQRANNSTKILWLINTLAVAVIQPLEITHDCFRAIAKTYDFQKQEL